MTFSSAGAPRITLTKSHWRTCSLSTQLKIGGHNSSAPYGYFHINSVEKFNDGSYLISSRYYCSLFKITKDGSVDWTLQVGLNLSTPGTWNI